MGGYLGFHLADNYHITSLFFSLSPALHDIAKPDVEVVSNQNILHYIVLGIHDDVVNPSETLKFLKNSNSNCIVKKEFNGHRTPLIIFKKSFEAFMNQFFS